MRHFPAKKNNKKKTPKLNAVFLLDSDDFSLETNALNFKPILHDEHSK